MTLKTLLKQCIKELKVTAEIDEDTELLLWSHEDTLKVCKWLLENGCEFTIHCYDEEDTSIEVLEY